MKIVFISDTHCQHTDVRLNVRLQSLYKEDPKTVLVHCGDVSSRGYRWEVEGFIKWFSNLPFEHKIFIAGNHDFIFEEKPQEIERMLAENPGAVYLEDSGVEIEGIKFWGSPVQPRFFDWAFNRDEDIIDHWNLIPPDIDVLITHGPPYGILDWTKRDNKSVGCPRLLEKIDQMNLKAHAFGHIHESFGIEEGPGLLARTKFINASYLDLRYDPVHDPIIIEI